ncbi:MAG: hypothetical protein CSA62_09740 [Planctomycetota bacterium]|nr:MAG: hypothetical protein CSA62_09740 [Planctomycetota bacterium]
MKIGHIPARQGGNPTIVGEDLTELPGEVGAFFRKRAEKERQARINNPWVQPVHRDLGKHRLGKVVKGVFEFKNPRDVDHHFLSINSSCSCQKVVLELNGKRRDLPKGFSQRTLIPKGAKGKIEMHIEVQRIGLRNTSVTLRLDDPDLPFLVLQATTRGVMDFIVEHEGRQISDLFLGQFMMKESRPFDVRVTAQDGKPFQIAKVLELPEGFEAKFEALDDKGLAWRVYGQVGPQLAEGSFQQSIRLASKDERQIEFQLTGIVSAPYKITPTVLNFGALRPGEGGQQSVEVLSLQKGFSVEVASADWVEGLHRTRSGQKPLDTKMLGLEVKERGAEGKAEILVTLPKDAPKGQIKARFLLRFKNPKLPPRMLQILAIVR